LPTLPFTVAEFFALRETDANVRHCIRRRDTDISVAARIASIVLFVRVLILSSKPERVDYAELVSKAVAFSLLLGKTLNYSSMKTLYFDCFAGASGNMILAALIAAGVDKEELLAELLKVGLPDFELRFETVDRSGISSFHVIVELRDEKAHRHLHHIEAIIKESRLSESIKERSLKIFRRLAEAEAKVHGISVEKVHFHEVGAMDAIIDVVGSCIGFEILGIERFACSRIHVGSGFVEMEHGKFPVPPPAVAELLAGIPIYSTEIVGELITPTGAAIISTLCDSYGTIPEMQAEVTAYGAGTREYEKFPNVLRIMIGETTDAEARTLVRVYPHDASDRLALLETNIDDSTPQVIGFVMDRAFELGSRDCWFTPIQMKKNRPGVLLSILCEPARKDALIEMIYAETTTIGIRISSIERHALEREIKTVSTEFGDIKVKIAKSGETMVNIMPEYDDVRRIALEKGVAFRIVNDAAIAKAKLLSNAVGR
jgi:uncharacterized protein (TIGR00299 family) protein